MTLAEGERVKVMHKRDVLFSGILETVEDDGDTYMANVEWWARVKSDGGSTFVFRQSITDGGPPSNGWHAKAKSLRKYGHRISIIREERRTS